MIYELDLGEISASTTMVGEPTADIDRAVLLLRFARNALNEAALCLDDGGYECGELYRLYSAPLPCSLNGRAVTDLPSQKLSRTTSPASRPNIAASMVGATSDEARIQRSIEVATE